MSIAGRKRVTVAAGLLSAVCWSAVLGQQLPETAEQTVYWRGTVTVPGSNLDLLVRFVPAGDGSGYSATIDIPVQSATDLPLVDVGLTKTDIAFTIAPPTGAVFEARINDDGRTAVGQLKQHGLTFPLTMERITAEEAQAFGLARPQTPKPPFPYKTRDVSYQNPVDSITLAGTLTIPAGDGPHPAVLMITGSGAQDRDETIFGHKPFLVIADHLTRHGFAVLRVDDRGVGGSTGSVAQATVEDSANDVLAGIKFLRAQQEIDGRRIALMGHSEGGVIAPLVASRSKAVAGIVLLAGSALPGDRILAMQTEALLRAAGKDEDAIRRVLEAHRAMLDCMVAGKDRGEIEAALTKLIKVQLQVGGQPEPTPQELAQVVAVHMRNVTSPWMRAFVRYDPRPVLKQVDCPVLALIGSRDLQVPPKKNLAAFEESLRAGGNKDFVAKEMSGLNHMFQPATTGMVDEYIQIEQTIAPEVLSEITDWLRSRLGGHRP